MGTTHQAGGTEPSDVKAAIDAVERLQPPAPVGAGTAAAGELIALPAGRSVVDLKPYLDARRDRPERRKGTARMTTLNSFVDHVLRFADPDSAIFAIDDQRTPKLVAVFDYHEEHARPGDSEEEVTTEVETEGRPRFGEHRCVYEFPLSDEWKAWRDACAHEMKQGDLAAFLEDRIVDVVDPDAGEGKARQTAAAIGMLALAVPSALLALARGLSIRVDRKVANAINLSSGEAQVAFEETHQAGDGSGPVKVPQGFVIGIPVFKNGEPYSIVVRLRYRVREGAILWRIALHRADAVFAHAFDEACSVAEGGTALPLFRGTPEA